MNMQDRLRAALQAAEAEANKTLEVTGDKLVDDILEGWDVDADVDDVLDQIDMTTEQSVVASPSVETSEATEPHDDGSTPQPVNTLTPQTIQIKNLDERAVLVSVKRRMYNPYKHDAEATAEYGVGNTNKKLFDGRDNRVKEALSKYSEVYQYVKDQTVPWSTGVEMLNMTNYMDFTSGLRGKIAAADAAVRDLVNNWDFEVQKDIQRIKDICARKGIPDRSDPNDYPTADEVEARFGIAIRYIPVPKVNDFDPRLGLSDADKSSLQQQLDDASTNATRHVLTQMIVPMQRAVEKLRVNIGDDGSIFRDSLIDNMVDVADRMNRVNLSDDPKITEAIRDLQSLVGTYASNKDMLRSTPSIREKAVTQIDDLMSKMQGLV